LSNENDETVIIHVEQAMLYKREEASLCMSQQAPI
jgi:hypothetical protein